jgi:hypothetical protein
MPNVAVEVAVAVRPEGAEAAVVASGRPESAGAVVPLARAGAVAVVVQP